MTTNALSNIYLNLYEKHIFD